MSFSPFCEKIVLQTSRSSQEILEKLRDSVDDWPKGYRSAERTISIGQLDHSFSDPHKPFYGTIDGLTFLI